MPPSLRWRVYYADGTTFDNLQGRPCDAPPFGVLAVVCVPDLWGSGDVFGLTQYLAERSMVRVVRFGVLAANDVYERVLRRARADTDFESDRHVYERGDFYWYNGVE